MRKSRVLVVGGTGRLGRRIVKASLAAEHPTYVLLRPEISTSLSFGKADLLMDLKRQGARLVEASFADRQSLVAAVKQADVVVSAMSNLLVQLELVHAIKEAGNIKRFLPSEFGMDPPRMSHALAPGRVTFEEKMVVREAVEEAGIPFTYVCGSCFAGSFVGGLCQLVTLFPSRDSVRLYGDGNVKSVFIDEDDLATYAIKTVDDPRALNKTVYAQPPENILSQREVVGEWEKLIGKELNKTSISAEEFLLGLNGEDGMLKLGISHFYHLFYEGCLTNFEAGDGAEEASDLYPDVNYTRVWDFLKRYL